jgi:hypothetical protein
MIRPARKAVENTGTTAAARQPKRIASGAPAAGEGWGEF